jgi:hypothetical protein
MVNEESCTKRFTTKAWAKQHADAVHRGLMIPCPLAEEGCEETFETSMPSTEE